MKFRLLEGDGFTARLGARALLVEQELAAGVIAPALIQDAGRLQWEGDLAIQILMQAVVIVRFVTQQQRRRSGLLMPVTEGEEFLERWWESFRLIHPFHPAIGDLGQSADRNSRVIL